MTRRVAVHRVSRVGADGERALTDELNYWFQCPGCETAHRFAVNAPAGQPSWTFNGSLGSPTFSPSLLMRWTHGPERERRVCHLFLRDGQLQFLPDCTHDLAGQTVPLPELPDWLRDDGGTP